MAEGLRDELSIDTNTPLKLEVSYQETESNSRDTSFLMKPRSLIRTFPGVFFSSYRQVASFGTVLVPITAFERISNDLWLKTNRAAPPPVPSPKATLLVRLKENPSAEERDFVTNGIRNFINSDFTQVIAVQDLVDSTKLAINGLVLFFNISMQLS